MMLGKNVFSVAIWPDFQYQQLSKSFTHFPINATKQRAVGKKKYTYLRHVQPTSISSTGEPIPLNCYCT